MHRSTVLLRQSRQQVKAREQARKRRATVAKTAMLIYNMRTKSQVAR